MSEAAKYKPEKMNFFEWYDWQERQPHEKPSTAWIENYVKNHAWKSRRFGVPVHDGDCTNMPYTCDLCVVTDLLNEYSDYFFDKAPKED